MSQSVPLPDPIQPVRQRSRLIELPCPPPVGQSLADLQHWHQQGLALWRHQRDKPQIELSDPLALKPDSQLYSWLEVKLELARRLLKSCNYCAHACQIDRLAGETGYCRLDARPRISGSYLHWGEEAPLNPTWAVFFSGCTMHCVYCHNWRETFDLAAGTRFDPAALAARLLAARGRFRTLSLIGGTPEPQLHAVLELVWALDETVTVPLVFNNNATLSASGLELMEGVVDVYLPDFKHGNDTCAWQLTRIADYGAIVTRNLQAYLGQRSALLIRHLVVPDHLNCCTRPILEQLARDFPGVAVNIMFQYRPMYQAMARPGLDRTLTRSEQEQVSDWIQDLSLRQVR